jgi:2-(1,2-epoxy-1,2-dihydrophenyl)acetyl-CoA isomerase
MATMSEAVVLSALADGVLTITLNRPKALNALNHNLGASLRDAIFAAEHEDAVRCLVIRGGEHFMAGGDLKWFDELARSRLPAENRVQFERLVRDTHALIVALRRTPKPVIASVRGVAAGFGMGLMMACDLAIAADTANFTLAYTLIGASPDGGSTYMLPRIVGAKKAMEIALLNERFDAATAERLGLVNRVVPAASLEAETHKLATRLAAGPLAACGRTKLLLNGSLNTSLETQLQREAEAFAQCASEPDFTEGIGAFLEKRKPQWRR